MVVTGARAGMYYMNGGKDSSIGIKAGIDILMTGIGFVGQIGFGISATYFIIDAKLMNLENMVK